MSKIHEALQRANLAADQLTAITAADNIVAPNEPVEIACVDISRPRSKRREVRSASFDVRLGSPLVPFEGKDPRAGEQYRILRTRIIQHSLQPRVIVVSSAAPGDGKSTTAVNLAFALALRPDVKVLLIDADIRRGTIGPDLGIGPSPGLAEYLAETCELSDVTVECANLPNLHVIPAGQVHANPCELLDSDRWRSTCMSVRNTYRFVIVDSPPIGAVADYELLQSVADGVLLIMRPDNTKRHLALRALEGVPKAKLIGVVLNGMEGWFVGDQDVYGARYYEQKP